MSGYLIQLFMYLQVLHVCLSICLSIYLSLSVYLYVYIHRTHTHTHPNGSIRIARIAWTFMLLSHSVGSIFLQMRNTSVYVILLEHVYKSYRPEPIYVYKQTHKDLIAYRLLGREP